MITEIGGLISHGSLRTFLYPVKIQNVNFRIVIVGAVVAREYGIPCVVGAQGATSMLKSGKIILYSLFHIHNSSLSYLE